MAENPRRRIGEAVGESFPGRDNQVHYIGCSVAAVRVRRTTRIELALAGAGSLAGTIDPLRATQSPGISPAFDRQMRQPRSHYFALESDPSCGANEKLRVRRPRQRLRSGSSRWFWRKPVSILARSKHRSKPGLDSVGLQPAKFHPSCGRSVSSG